MDVLKNKSFSLMWLYPNRYYPQHTGTVGEHYSTRKKREKCARPGTSISSLSFSPSVLLLVLIKNHIRRESFELVLFFHISFHFAGLKAVFTRVVCVPHKGAKQQGKFFSILIFFYYYFKLKILNVLTLGKDSRVGSIGVLFTEETALQKRFSIGL